MTGAEVGYAGLINLPKDISVFIDESVSDRLNFETGANKTNFHAINVNFGRDIPLPGQFYDLKIAREGDSYPDTNEPYKVMKAAEVGNIFPLYDKFSNAFNYKFIDQDGKEKSVYMGCYGIGPSRIMGVIVEKFHDERGIIWPDSVSPFNIHLIGLDLQDENVKKKIFSVYEQLTKKYKLEVLFDDRENVTAGEKFSDADLIGIPVRLVVSKRSGEKIEFKKRDEKDPVLLSFEELIKKLI